MRSRSLILSVIFSVLILSAVEVRAQQRYIASASGEQSLPSNASTRRLFVEVSINPPTMPANAANLVFRGRGGSTFPAGSTAAVYKNGSAGQPGVIVFTVPFAPESSWLVAADVSAQDLVWLRENKWYVQVNTPEFLNGEVRGQFHLVHGTYNDHDGDCAVR